ncbi:MAG: hypothetical protein A4E72_02040 [Syntrophus sp. PtaU1.Bin208]|nr:MAG: hypothetical protein A4E72_02040 [Syntrophus sp. PtaU1.Bin208]
MKGRCILSNDGLRRRSGQGLVLQGPEGTAEGFEIGRFFGDDQTGYFLFQVIHHDGIPGGSADEHHVAAGKMAKDFQNFPRHHLTETRCNPSFGDAFVAGMGTVAFAEYAAASGYLIGLFLPGEGDGFLQAKVQTADLLKKEFAGSRGAFVPRLDGADLAVFSENVNKKGFSTGADDRIQGGIAVVDERQGRLHGLGLGKGSEIDERAELPPRYCDTVIPIYRERGEEIQEGLAGIAVVGFKLKQGPLDSCFRIVADGNSGQCGCTDAYAETVHSVRKTSKNKNGGGDNRRIAVVLHDG